jgi:hypothetical protein
MDQVSLQGIEPSVGTRMFNLFGLLSILFNLNQEKKQICSPLSNKKRIPKSRFTWEGEKLPSKPIHLWFNNKLNVDNLFKENISLCINSSCEFIIVSLNFKYGLITHINYIIINNGEAYRIEPYGHGQIHMDDMDTELTKLFDNYGITYVSHSELEGFSERGLQTIGEEQEVYEYLFPGYCNTYVFIYIEGICKYHQRNPKLRGIDLFKEALNHVNDKHLKSEKGFTDKLAFEYNRQLVSIQKVFYDQLIESKLLFKRYTRNQRRKMDADIELQEQILKTKYYSPKRKNMEIITFDNVSDILYELSNKNILTIYGIEFEKLYSGEISLAKSSLKRSRGSKKYKKRNKDKTKKKNKKKRSKRKRRKKD